MLMTKSRTVSVKPAYTVSNRKSNFLFFRFLMTAAFVFYLVSVLYLVLGERLFHGNASWFHHSVQTKMPYWKQVKQHVQLIPFKTIFRYAGRLKKANPLRLLAFVNLAGNLALFFPMGIFLPYFRKKQKNFIRFSVSVILMIVCVEVTQVLTLLGACDIDDLILNYAGAVCGFVCFQILDLIRRKIYAGRNTGY